MKWFVVHHIKSQRLWIEMLGILITVLNLLVCSTCAAKTFGGIERGNQLFKKICINDVISRYKKSWMFRSHPWKILWGGMIHSPSKNRNIESVAILNAKYQGLNNSYNIARYVFQISCFIKSSEKVEWKVALYVLTLFFKKILICYKIL